MILLTFLAISSTVSELPTINQSPSLVENEIKLLDTLIYATEKNLADQKKIKQDILDYQKGLALYLENSSDKEVVLSVARKADSLLNEIKEAHLIDTFEPDFISELTLFSQIAQKKGIPRPL